MRICYIYYRFIKIKYVHKNENSTILFDSIDNV